MHWPEASGNPVDEDQIEWIPKLQHKPVSWQQNKQQHQIDPTPLWPWQVTHNPKLLSANHEAKTATPTTKKRTWAAGAIKVNYIKIKDLTNVVVDDLHKTLGKSWGEDTHTPGEHITL